MRGCGSLCRPPSARWEPQPSTKRGSTPKSNLLGLPAMAQHVYGPACLYTNGSDTDEKFCFLFVYSCFWWGLLFCFFFIVLFFCFWGVFLAFCFVLATLQLVPGQGSDPSNSFDLSCSCGNARSLTRCARPGIKPELQHCQDVTNPVTPQWERLSHFFFGFIFFCWFVCHIAAC